MYLSSETFWLATEIQDCLYMIIWVSDKESLCQYFTVVWRFNSFQNNMFSVDWHWWTFENLPTPRGGVNFPVFYCGVGFNSFYNKTCLVPSLCSILGTQTKPSHILFHICEQPLVSWGSCKGQKPIKLGLSFFSCLNVQSAVEVGNHCKTDSCKAIIGSFFADLPTSSQQRQIPSQPGGVT